MQQSDLAQFWVAPLWRALQGVMDLHVALAVAVARKALGNFRRFGAGQQPLVKLVGRHRGDHAERSGNLSPIREPDAARGALLVERNRDNLRRGSDFAALVLNERGE